MSASADNAEIIADVSISNGGIYASGTITGVEYPCSMLIMVFEDEKDYTPDNLKCIGSASTDEEGNFEITCSLEGIPYGQYAYFLGSDKDKAVITGTVCYEKQYITQNFMNAELDVNIRNNVPEFTGTIECFGGRKTVITVSNITDGDVVLNRELAPGENNISFSLPSLYQNKNHIITLISYNGLEKLTTLNTQINSSLLSLSLAGNIKNSENVSLDINAQSSGLINEATTVTTEKNFSATIPNIASNATISLQIKGYEIGDVQQNIPQPIDITKSENAPLYNALTAARPGLDYDNNNTLTAQELSSISGVLDLSNKNIDDINGLQSCTNINQLYINNNHISDISPLRALHNLVTLVADHNELEHITYLPYNLKLLNIENNNISSLTGLDALTEIEIIFAGYNNIVGINWLNNKSKLRYLTLNDNNITDISPLGHCDNLVHLNMANNMISDISVLSDNIHLKFLKLSNNEITDISCLPDIFYHSLYLEDNYITSGDIAEFSAVNKMYRSK